MFFTCDEKRQWKSNIKYLVPAWERLTETKIKYFLFLPFSPPFPEFPLLVFTKHNADPQNIVTAFIARQTSQPFNIGALWKLQNNGTRIFFARGKPKDIFSSWGGYEYFDCALSITDEQSSANKKYVTLNSVNRWSESAQVFDLTFLVWGFNSKKEKKSSKVTKNIHILLYYYRYIPHYWLKSALKEYLVLFIILIEIMFPRWILKLIIYLNRFYPVWFWQMYPSFLLPVYTYIVLVYSKNYVP